MTDKFLDSTYSLDTPQETESHYKNWAATYDKEIEDHGYVTPTRVAAALWSAHPHPETQILDFGCGTGLSGQALRAVGFELIDGMDPTPKMLEEAKAKGVYRALTGFDITKPAPLKRGAYSVITAIGVIGQGAAPAETIDVLMHALPKRGLFAFSLNDHALADHTYTCRITDWVDMGAARLLFREHGPHLPGINLNSDVYVLEKA
ncbi:MULTISPECIES: class I SAM-dependent methyltransferase [unclassified Ruegeria]|uniref:class I SAM-dependent DNA methyltransferase n=1 Tax=unclassified Ruegeria TaxID=2625375 RepID=UPI00148A028A|nr:MULTISPECIES: methyltransferase domain-containing protein [unclassified Ruegeria]NOD75460.1 methyltransferase domain-containing protein [Ruegeria sp. HKCCD4332]NOD87442.1 methyltransferase domain-containing protein [Ruegeria sp. HKCCD4318]NOE12997.1 methyltransferase domain-containing protein [Ruegeria sp. HKCCD4318-2]NOG08836.1 methyltransferase domain-containing protein [Ruegeria sp. HKCCD4315]